MTALGHEQPALIKVLDECFSRAAIRSPFQHLVDGKLTAEWVGTLELAPTDETISH